MTRLMDLASWTDEQVKVLEFVLRLANDNPKLNAKFRHYNVQGVVIDIGLAAAEEIVDRRIGMLVCDGFKS